MKVKKGAYRARSTKSGFVRPVMMDSTRLVRRDFLGGGGIMVDEISASSKSRLGLRGAFGGLDGSDMLGNRKRILKMGDVKDEKARRKMKTGNNARSESGWRSRRDLLDTCKPLRQLRRQGNWLSGQVESEGEATPPSQQLKIDQWSSEFIHGTS